MSGMIEVKTADLIGPALDWAVASIERPHVRTFPGGENKLWIVGTETRDTLGTAYSPSTDWSQGGPLIEKHKISLHCPQHAGDVWAAWREDEFVVGATTALQAACRAIVLAKAGETVQVPKELMR